MIGRCDNISNYIWINIYNITKDFFEHISRNVPLGFLPKGTGVVGKRGVAEWRHAQDLMNIQWNIAESQLSRWGESDMNVNRFCCSLSLQDPDIFLWKMLWCNYCLIIHNFTQHCTLKLYWRCTSCSWWSHFNITQSAYYKMITVLY